MGQQPNIRIGMEDLPRATAKEAPARRWSPDRPGDLVSPQSVPWGGSFGTPGPDAGFALMIVRGRELALLEGETRADVETAVAVIMAARASQLGRAPIPADALVAEALLGFGSVDPSWRLEWTKNLAHDHRAARQLVAAVDRTALTAPLDGLLRRIEAGERLVAGRP